VPDVNLDELRAVQDREREKDSLQHLRDSFYEEVGQYIGDLRAERERRAERAEDPFADSEVRRLTDEIETAEEVAESIYERRMGKVVKTASLAAAGYRAETEGLTEEEAALFEDLVERIEANQETVLEVLSGDAAVDPLSESEGPAEPPHRAEEAPEAVPVEGESSIEQAPEPAASDPTAAGDGTSPDPGSSETDSATSDDAGAAPSEDRSTEDPADSEIAAGLDAAAAMGDVDRVTVRITADVGEIVGVDGTAYDLETDDVVDLPEENALPLVEKDAARKVE